MKQLSSVLRKLRNIKKWSKGTSRIAAVALQSQTALSSLWYKSHCFRLPISVLCPLFWNYTAQQQACKIDELVHGPLLRGWSGWVGGGQDRRGVCVCVWSFCVRWYSQTQQVAYTGTYQVRTDEFVLKLFDEESHWQIFNNSVYYHHHTGIINTSIHGPHVHNINCLYCVHNSSSLCSTASIFPLPNSSRRASAFTPTVTSSCVCFVFAKSVCACLYVCAMHVWEKQ